MKMPLRRLSIVALAMLAFARIDVSAQGEAEWINNVKETIRAKEPGWKITNTLVNQDPTHYGESFRLTKGSVTGGVQISSYRILENPEETFIGLLTISDNIKGKRQTKTKLEGIGDEAYMWSGRNANDFVTVFFKKDKTYVTVFLPGRITAQRFARHVAAHLP